MVTLSIESWVPTPEDTAYLRLGGTPGVKALVEAFYDAMETHERALANLHRIDADGRVSREARDRFALFLVGWLGGPQDYMALHGHPRLRMRHAKVPVSSQMRDAWLRSMDRAMDKVGVSPQVRSFLRSRLGEVADFLRNTSD